MHCTQCGARNEQDARFCAECGAKMASVETIQQQAAGQDFSEPVQPTQGQTVESQPNEFLEKSKEIAIDLFAFAKRSFVAPMQASRKVTKDDMVSGIIVHVLFAFFLPLFTYISAVGFAKDMYGEMYGGVGLPFGSFVFKPFFFLLLYLALYAAVVFGVSKMMKSNVSYIEVVTRFAAFTILPASLLVVAILFSLMSANVFSMILFGAAIGLFFVSSVALVFSVKEENTGGLDVFYGLIITNIAIYIIFLVIGDSIAGNIINQLENMPYGGLY
ncbi:zinc ribbon domain-containing protein [Aquibacillus koreensis]|uniref:Zinc ribbon domain-containing protein n=1 Tax=Aquibacillus koreensis TaxID=279446 RepID=A0A9X3WKI4_9BACI|nr:zinc ribbon domain-containing protein [Aquibacillus koreensis]MCT2536637.1 zinc ribbon domain-containing protein [Aquibacillus koreensis]MDC3419976.1 zinc ribbon domain-containing protein [Aquibacillus koreensis]